MKTSQDNTSHDIRKLDDLVAATRGGKTFYQHVAARLDDPDLKSLFNRIAKMKGDIVRELSTEVSAAGESSAKSGTWASDFNRFYTDIRAVPGDLNYAYVARLEDSEDQLLKAFEKALCDEETTSTARATIVDLLPEARICHDLMRARKIALKHAA